MSHLNIPPDRFADPGILGFGETTPLDRVPQLVIRTLNVTIAQWGFPADYDMSTWQVMGNTSWVKGNHLLKFGYDGRLQKWGRKDGPGNEILAQVFSGVYSRNGVADFLFGFPFNGNQRASFFPTAQNLNDYSFYVQDDWKVTSNLTLNPGLRYELHSRPDERNNLLTSFDPASGKAVVGGTSINQQYANQPTLDAYGDRFVQAPEIGLPPGTLAFGDHNNFAPRLGFAWRPFNNSRVVLRGGYGIFYMIEWSNVSPWTVGSTPYGSGAASFLNSRPVPSVTIREPFAGGVNPVPRPQPRYRDPFARDGYMQMTTLGIQTELPWQMVGEINFIDQKSENLEAHVNLNQSRPGTGRAGTPFPQFGSLLSGVYHDGYARYDALELIVRKRSEAYTFEVSHVWAKNMSRVSPEDPYNREQYYGPTGYVPHETKFRFLVDLPFGRGRQFLNQGGLVDAIVGGWTTAGFFRHRTGGPLTPRWAAGNPANVSRTPLSRFGDLVGARPDRSCDGRISNPTMSQWFDTSCFSAPTLGTFGSSGTGIIFGPNSWTADFGIHKNFTIVPDRDIRLQVRAEMFNVFNHPNFGNPYLRANVSSVFGRIVTKTLSPRVIQIALRLNF